jgi:hypothetical protein
MCFQIPASQNGERISLLEAPYEDQAEFREPIKEF